MSTRMKNAALTVFSVTVTLILLMLCDRFLLARFAGPYPHSLVFPAYSVFHHETPEFSYTARVNSLGFRDREWQTEKEQSTIRILAIGDSFTFGWGVENNQAWPKVLENRLRERGYNIEIANLGRAGGSPGSYVQVARKAIPVLKPDLIILATLQADDLAQTMMETDTSTVVKDNATSDSFTDLVKSGVRSMLPNAYTMTRQYLKKRRASAARRQLLRDEWKAQAESLFASYGDDELARFESLDQTVKDMFLEGGLNPALIGITVSDPAYVIDTFDTDNPKVQIALDKMTEHYSEIKKEAEKAGSSVIVLSVPYGFISERDLNNRKKIGFSVLPGMLSSSLPDDAIRKVSEASGLLFLDVTNQFRIKAETDTLFFEYDGHFNAKGHAVFAELLMPLFEECILDKGGMVIQPDECINRTP